ncbi:MAG: TspO/MBR family protein [Armatimonadota bacterium]
MKSPHQQFALVVFIVVCLLAGAIGSLFTTPSIASGWYASLPRPPWNPPSWLFGPVWTTLYILMGVSAWLVWRKAGFRGAALPMTFFAIQLLLNIAWSVIFFGLHQVGLAFAEILLLWLAILATLITFWKRTPVAGVLLLPYLLWVSFAATLNYAIWRG